MVEKGFSLTSKAFPRDQEIALESAHEPKGLEKERAG